MKYLSISILHFKYLIGFRIFFYVLNIFTDVLVICIIKISAATATYSRLGTKLRHTVMTSDQNTLLLIGGADIAILHKITLDARTP